MTNDTRTAFWVSLKKGFFRMYKQAPSFWNDRNVQHYYRTEKRLIDEHIFPLYSGLAGSCFFFLTLRFTRSRWFSKRFSDYVKDVSEVTIPRVAEKEGEKPQWKNYLQRKAEEKKAFKMNYSHPLQGLPGNIIFSFLGGVYIAVLSTDGQKLKCDFVEAPLLPGKSLIHQFICPEMMNSFNKLETHEVFGQTDDSTLLTFHAFVRNCATRSSYIQQHRVQGNDHPNADVVPYPGLEGVRIAKS